MNHGHRIAQAVKQQAERTSRHVSLNGTTKLGVVASVSPLTIIPANGAVPLPSEALFWSNTALLTRDDWQEGYTVAMSMVDGDTYIVHDVIDTGAVIEIGGGGPATDPSFLSIAKWGVD